jgi:hypothetical protein
MLNSFSELTLQTTESQNAVRNISTGNLTRRTSKPTKGTDHNIPIPNIFGNIDLDYKIITEDTRRK